MDLTDMAGRTILFLEGGYALGGLRASVAACASRLAGGSYRPEPASSGGAGMAHVAGYRRAFLEEIPQP
jgi:acetoin utilization deacetylase AcuC-like enzyme